MEAATHPAPAGALEAPARPRAGGDGSSWAARVGRAVARGPLNILLLGVSSLWLLPTLGLLLTSLLPSSLISTTGWWKVIAHPSLLTFSNYQRDLEERRHRQRAVDDGRDLGRQHGRARGHRRARGLRVRMDALPRPRHRSSSS